MRIIIECKEKKECVNYTPPNDRVVPGSHTRVYLSVELKPDIQTGERLVNAFKHLLKSLNEEIKLKGADPNDPFSKPIKP